MEATFVSPDRSHWLAPAHASGGELSKEELYPILEVSNVPRVGTVRASFSVDRYRHSSGWSDWRIIVRDLEPATGIGPVTREAIREVCYPVIRGWLESGAYTIARRRAAAALVRRIIIDAGPRLYRVESARLELERYRSELAPMEADSLSSALDSLETAAAILEREAVAA